MGLCAELGAILVSARPGFRVLGRVSFDAGVAARHHSTRDHRASDLPAGCPATAAVAPVSWHGWTDDNDILTDVDLEGLGWFFELYYIY